MHIFKKRNFPTLIAAENNLLNKRDECKHSDGVTATAITATAITATTISTATKSLASSYSRNKPPLLKQRHHDESNQVSISTSDTSESINLTIKVSSQETTASDENHLKHTEENSKIDQSKSKSAGEASLTVAAIHVEAQLSNGQIIDVNLKQQQVNCDSTPDSPKQPSDPTSTGSSASSSPKKLDSNTVTAHNRSKSPKSERSRQRKLTHSSSEKTKQVTGASVTKTSIQLAYCTRNKMANGSRSPIRIVSSSESLDTAASHTVNYHQDQQQKHQHSHHQHLHHQMADQDSGVNLVEDVQQAVYRIPSLSTIISEAEQKSYNENNTTNTNNNNNTFSIVATSNENSSSGNTTTTKSNLFINNASRHLKNNNSSIYPSSISSETSV